MTKAIIYPYKLGSKSAKTLAIELEGRRVLPDGKYIPRVQHTIINWGNSKVPNWYEMARRRGVRILNLPASVAKASNKLTAFKTMNAAGVSVVPYTDRLDVAEEWLEDDKVMCRKLLSSHSGNGLIVAGNRGELVSAPLYTKYIQKKSEYRVHVFQGKIIDYAEKKKHNEGEYEGRSKYVRSAELGWVFCREGIELPKMVKVESVLAVRALGLDFGAVDIILGRDNHVYVLEVNTAVGIEGTTIEKYKNAFAEFLGYRRG